MTKVVLSRDMGKFLPQKSANLYANYYLIIYELPGVFIRKPCAVSHAAVKLKVLADIIL